MDYKAYILILNQAEFHDVLYAKNNVEKDATVSICTILCTRN